MQGRPVDLFFHVPKVAGSTLYTVMDRQYPSRSTYTFGDSAQQSEQALREMDHHERQGLRLVRGHMTFGLHELFDGPTRYFTVLREPVSRVNSHYNYAASLPQHYLHGEIVRSDGRVPLEALLERGTDVTMDNGAVRQLVGLGWDVPFGQVTAEHGRRAVEILESDFAAVGITEDFDASLLLIAEVLGWSKSIAYRRANVTRGGVRAAELSSSTSEAIRSANAEDIRLYEAARRLFESQVQVQGPGFERRLQRHRARQAALDILGRPAASVRRLAKRALRS